MNDKKPLDTDYHDGLTINIRPLPAVGESKRDEEALKEARRELATPFNVEEVILAIPDEDALAKNPKEILKSEIQKYENDFKEFKSQLLIDDRLEDVEVVIETGKGTPEDLYAANTYRGFEKKIVAHQKALEKKELESQ